MKSLMFMQTTAEMPTDSPALRSTPRGLSQKAPFNPAASNFESRAIQPRLNLPCDGLFAMILSKKPISEIALKSRRW